MVTKLCTQLTTAAVLSIHTIKMLDMQVLSSDHYIHIVANLYQRLIDITTGKHVVNVNGKARVSSRISDFKACHYQIKSSGELCGYVLLTTHP